MAQAITAEMIRPGAVIELDSRKFTCAVSREACALYSDGVYVRPLKVPGFLWPSAAVLIRAIQQKEYVIR